MRVDSEFLNHSVLLRIEGFDQQKLLSSCLHQKIMVRDIGFENNISMVLRISRRDLTRLKKIAGNRHRVTILKEEGARPLLHRLLLRKSTLVGFLLFFLLMIYQGAFVSEIQIYGYEHLQEAEIRQIMAREGLYEGARKNIDLNSVEAALYRSFDNLSWIGIKYIGNMAEVNIVEGNKPASKKDTSAYTHVVATKEGYIEKIIPRNGLRSVADGAYVKPGDVVINGLMPIEDKTFENREGVLRPVHGEGEVWARILYRFTYYQERYELVKKPTGKNYYGLSLQIGDRQWDSSRFFWPYDSALRQERKIFQCIRPFPVKLGISKVSEVELYRRERTQEEIKRLASAKSRQAVKENMAENTQILNNSLKFSAKENIIEISIMLHALEEIGKEEAFTYMVTSSGIKEDTGGTTPFGQSTE